MGVDFFDYFGKECSCSGGGVKYLDFMKINFLFCPIRVKHGIFQF
jgi:hypothetical protein